MHETDFIRIARSSLCGLPHQRAHRAVGQQQAPELLINEFRPFAAQHFAPLPQMGFDFVKAALQIPPLRILGGQFPRGGLCGIKDVGSGCIGDDFVADIADGDYAGGMIFVEVELEGYWIINFV